MSRYEHRRTKHNRAWKRKLAAELELDREWRRRFGKVRLVPVDIKSLRNYVRNN